MGRVFGLQPYLGNINFHCISCLKLTRIERRRLTGRNDRSCLVVICIRRITFEIDVGRQGRSILRFKLSIHVAVTYLRSKSFAYIYGEYFQLSLRALDPSFGLLFQDRLSELEVDSTGTSFVMSVFDANINFSGTSDILTYIYVCMSSFLPTSSFNIQNLDLCQVYSWDH